MKINALEVIPHCPPMVFIDHIVEHGENFAVAQLHVSPELMFSDAQGLPTWCSIEIMAQTVSAFAGIQGSAQGHAPKIGFLLGTRKLELPKSHFAQGSQLNIRVHRQYLHEGLGQFLCEIDDQQDKISALLSVYEPEVDARTLSNK